MKGKLLLAALFLATVVPSAASASSFGLYDDPLYLGATNWADCVGSTDPSRCYNASNAPTIVMASEAFPYSSFLVHNVKRSDWLQGNRSPNGFAITGESDEGTGVFGFSHLDKPGVAARNDKTGAALTANAYLGDGVFSTTQGSLASGVYGENLHGGFGVAGRAHGGRPGVLGDNTGGGGDGVVGNSASGNGVTGRAATYQASGVFGVNTGTGYGVAGRATTPSGIGVRASNLVGGVALMVDGQSRLFGPATISGTAWITGETSLDGGVDVTGKASFSRSGAIAVPTGASSVVKTGVSLTAASLVLATLQTSATGLYVEAAVPHPATSSFTLVLSKAAPAGVKVGWFVAN